MAMHDESGKEAAGAGARPAIPVLLPAERPGTPGVLVVSPDDVVGHATALYLRLNGGYAVVTARSLEEAAACRLPFAPALLLLHATRGQALCALLLREIRGRTGAELIVLVSDLDTEEFEGLRAHAPRDIFLMPADPEILMDVVEDAVRPGRQAGEQKNYASQR